MGWRPWPTQFQLTECELGRGQGILSQQRFFVMSTLQAHLQSSELQKLYCPSYFSAGSFFSSMCDNYFLHFSAHRFCKKQADSDNELLFCLFGHCFCLFSHCFCNFGFPRKVENIVAKNSVAKSVISENQYYIFLQFVCKKCSPPQTF